MKNRLFGTCLIFALIALSAIFLLNLSLKSSYDVAIRYNYPVVEKEMATKLPDKMHDTDKQEDTQSTAVAEDNDVAPLIEEAVYFPLELNSATQSQLMEIPKIGRVTAGRIVQYRDYLGGYQNLEQLMDIKGIGEKTFNDVTAYLYLTGDEWDKSS